MPLRTSVIRHHLETEWQLNGPEVTSHDGGMNSQTWFVRSGSDRYVAKAVPAGAHRRFVSGLAVAAIVQAAGVPSGAAVPARDSRGFVDVDGHTLALLTFVNGSGLAETDQQLIGSTLARVHGALIGHRLPQVDRFHWIDPDAAHLGVRDWVRPAISNALASWQELPADS